MQSYGSNRPVWSSPDIVDKLGIGFTFTGRLQTDVPAFLIHHECPHTAAHVAAVAAEARRIAQVCDVDADLAETAAWLHDISAVIPNRGRIPAAQALGIDVLPEEAQFPLIIHQKLSVSIAAALFGVSDAAVLSAIGCHTTLKAGASRLDKVVFVADKIAWDQPGTPPYLTTLQNALAGSLDHAVRVYLEYLWAMRDSLKVIHPWMRDAYLESLRDSGTN